MEIDLLRLLEINAYAVHINCLIGTAPPAIRRLEQELREPRVGDLVLECSTIYDSPSAHDGNRLGRLKRIMYERYTDEDGLRSIEVPVEEAHPTGLHRKIWYIETPDGREFRWHNASFIKVCENLTVCPNERE